MRSLNRYLREDVPLKVAETKMVDLTKELRRDEQKEANLRKAMKFNLTRSQHYYIMKAAFNRLRPEDD